MRIPFALCGLLSMTSAAAQPSAPSDSISPVSVSGQVQLANMGFAPVPAFSFNSPIVTGLLSVKKKQFSFQPDAAVGLNGNPWMANNWFRFMFSERKRWKTNIGINPSLFFKTEKMKPGEELVRAYRNLTFEVGAERRICGVVVHFTWQNIHAFDEGTLSGNFLDISSPLTFVPLKRKLIFHARPQVFYFNFDGNVDGLFTSATVTMEFTSLPLSVYTQGVLPLWTNFPGNSFKWNFGVFVTFK
jgi:hypothetical protein